MKYFFIIFSIFILIGCGRKQEQENVRLNYNSDHHEQDELRLKHAQAYFLKGKQYYKEKKDDLAISNYELSLQNHEDAETYYYYGNSLMNLQRYEEAIEAYVKADQGSYDKQHLVLYNIACAYSLTSNYLQSGIYLLHAYQKGYHNIGRMKNDPDLANLRAQFSTNVLDLAERQMKNDQFIFEKVLKGDIRSFKMKYWANNSADWDYTEISYTMNGDGTFEEYIIVTAGPGPARYPDLGPKKRIGKWKIQDGGINLHYTYEEGRQMPEDPEKNTTVPYSKGVNFSDSLNGELFLEGIQRNALSLISSYCMDSKINDELEYYLRIDDSTAVYIEY